MYAGLSLGALSAGRAAITMVCSQYMSLASTIAIRYCAVRKQFGPTEDNELPVIEYQTQVRITVGFLFRSEQKKIIFEKYVCSSNGESFLI